mmetsp:Transcript_31255/g.58702  ORF Transcript_31255/g.58702 Transcript_31255/m.58702 type:complete len:227 (-) Transcript_31255:22-702(-)
MIHVFNCAKEACALPGRACLECGKVCSQIDCEPCKHVCDECGKTFKGFFDKPLSTYVVVKVILAAMQLYFCYSALSMKSMKNCSPSGAIVDGPTWLQIQMGFACVHLLFSPYFQSRIWQKVAEKFRERHFSLEGGDTVPQRTIYESFREVFLYDIGVLFYALILVLSLVWSLKGTAYARCDADGSIGWASYIGVCFFWVAVIYNFCYYYCGCCAGSVQLSDLTALE